MKISELSKQQCGHLAWRLDHNTCCGFITARRIAYGELGDLDLIEVFMKYGNRSHRSAAILTRKVVEYKPPFSEESEERIQIAVQQIGRILIFNSLEHCELLEVQRWFKDFVRIRSDLNKQLKE